MALEDAYVGCDENTPARAHQPGPINTPDEVALYQQVGLLPVDEVDEEYDESEGEPEGDKSGDGGSEDEGSSDESGDEGDVLEAPDPNSSNNVLGVTSGAAFDALIVAAPAE